MKKLLTITLTLLGILVAGATLAQSEVTRSVSPFSKISVNKGVDVFIKKGDKEEVRIVSNYTDLNEILTEVKSDKLKISVEGKYKKYKKFDIKVYVTYKSIRQIKTAFKSSLISEEPIEATNLDDPFFTIEAGMGSRIDVSLEGGDKVIVDASMGGAVNLNVQANSIKAMASGGKITVVGKVKKQEVEATNRGVYNGGDLESEKAHVVASDSGKIKVNATLKLTGNATTEGSIKYKGKPKKNVSSTSGGTVSKFKK